MVGTLAAETPAAHQQAVRDRIVALRELGEHVEGEPFRETQYSAQDEAADGACASMKRSR